MKSQPKKKRKKKRKKRRWHGKGAQWERDVARTLSQWWSKKGDDDLFWRTHSSGARATVRSKRGKKTRGQYGDLCAVDSRGRTFTKAFVVSLKRGYKGITLQDLLDKLENPNREGEFESWIREAGDASISSDSIGWLLILKRDRRQPLLLMPGFIFLKMDRSMVRAFHKLKPHVRILARIRQFPPLRQKDKKKMTKKKIRQYKKKSKKRRLMSIYGTTLQNFLDTASRGDIADMVRKQ